MPCALTIGGNGDSRSSSKPSTCGRKPLSASSAAGRGRPRPAALLAMSGFIPRVPGFELDLESPFPPIAIVHGTYDPVIPVEFGREARDLLVGAGAEVEYRESPIEHWIDPQVVPLLRSLI